MTLRSLRADIAQSLEVLARSAALNGEPERWHRLNEGAETLRYIEALDRYIEALDPEPDDAADEDDYRRVVEALELCQDFALQFMNKRLTAAKFRDAVLRTCEATL